MLQTMRDSLQGIVAYCIIGSMIVMFALWGVEAMVQGRTSVHGDAIATVNGKDVTEIDVRRGMAVRKHQLEEMMGGKVDPQFLTDEFLRKPVVDSLVRQRVLESAVEDNHLHVADTVIDRQIVSDKNFQVQGKFDRTHYANLIGQFGYTPATYRDELTREYLLNQFQDSLLHSDFVTDKAADEMSRMQLEKRSFEYLVLPLAKTLATMTASDDEIKAYYDKHKTDQFLSEEKVSVDYIELNRDALASGITASADDIQKKYDAEVGAAKNKVTRHAAHILVKENPDGSPPATLKEIQQRLAKGEDFAALAKQYSADTGSAQQGGDLGETTGDSFVPEFEAALDKLTVGQVSGPVKTKFGYHLIKLLDLKEPKVETLEASRLRIEAAIKKQQATELYADKKELMRDAGQSGASLANIVSKLALSVPVPVQHREGISRREAMMVFRSKSISDAIFADGMEAGKNTDVIESQEGHAILLRLTDRKPSVVQPLDQVRTQVAESVRKEKSAVALANDVQGLQARLKAGESMEKLAQEKQVEWKNFPDISREDASVNADVLKKAFAMPIQDAGHPATDSVSLPNGDMALLQLLAVKAPTDAELTAEQKAKSKEDLQSSISSHEFAAMETLLEASAKIIRKQTTASDQ